MGEISLCVIMSKRGIQFLSSPFDAWEGIGSIVELLRAAVDTADIAALGKILQDDTIDKDELKSRDPEIYSKGNDMFQSWISSLVVGDKLDFWHTRFQHWYTISLCQNHDNSNFLIHFLQFNKKFDEVVNLLCCKVLPAFTMVKPKKKPVRTTRAPVYELVPVDELPPVESILTTTTIEEDAAYRTQSGRLLRGRCQKPESKGQGSAEGGAGGAPAAVPDGTVGNGDNKNPTRRKNHHTRKKNEEALEDLADWVCAICRQMEAVDGSNLLLCEGGCRRSFHFYCLGLDQVLPPPDMV